MLPENLMWSVRNFQSLQSAQVQRGVVVGSSLRSYSFSRGVKVSHLHKNWRFIVTDVSTHFQVSTTVKWEHWLEIRDVFFF